MPRLSPAAKRALLAKTREQLDAKLRAIDKKIAKDERKKDTRRKIIAGAIWLEHLQGPANDPAQKKLRDLLQEYVEPRDRHLFPFLPAPELTLVQSEAPDLLAEAAE